MLTNEKALNLNIDQIQKAHFIGICSPFSSFCATNLLNAGVKVTASELNQNNEISKMWIDKGVLFEGGHNKKYITEDLDLVVYPNAPIPGNPECEKAENLGLTSVSVAQLTGVLSKKYKTIAIAGTHGKTTTTALVIWLIHKTMGTPNFIIGDAEDRIFELDKNYNVNKDSDIFVVEACEYKKQFLQRAPKPTISVITNIDLDHTDFFPTQESYNKAFTEFLSSTTQYIIIDGSHPNEKSVLEKVKSPKVIDTSKLSPEKPLLKELEHISGLPGEHNKQNLLRAYGVGVALGIDENKIIKTLKSFPGLSKRFEYIGETENGNAVYKDFAHNPQKIRAVINSAKETYPDRKVVLVWQPHSLERTNSFKNELIDALEMADTIILSNIYVHAREKGLYENLINTEDFFNDIKDAYPNKKTIFGGDSKETVQKTLEYEKTQQEKSLVIVFASAGDLHREMNSFIS